MSLQAKGLWNYIFSKQRWPGNIPGSPKDHDFTYVNQNKILWFFDPKLWDCVFDTTWPKLTHDTSLERPDGSLFGGRSRSYSMNFEGILAGQSTPKSYHEM